MAMCLREMECGLVVDSLDNSTMNVWGGRSSKLLGRLTPLEP